jgi:quercetin dioxygenase-like cupin family protein
MKNIERIAPVNIGPALAALRAHDFLFTVMTQRQSIGPHTDTESIFLRWPTVPSLENIMDGFERTDYPALTIEGFARLLREVEGRIGRPAERAMIIRLKPGGKIGEHIDQGLYADCTHRFHVPLVTNPAAWLNSGEETAHLEAGVLYLFNKHVPHSGANDGDSPRVHLVVDVLA